MYNQRFLSVELRWLCYYYTHLRLPCVCPTFSLTCKNLLEFARLEKECKLKLFYFLLHFSFSQFKVKILHSFSRTNEKGKKQKKSFQFFPPIKFLDSLPIRLILATHAGRRILRTPASPHGSALSRTSGGSPQGCTCIASAGRGACRRSLCRSPLSPRERPSTDDAQKRKTAKERRKERKGGSQELYHRFTRRLSRAERGELNKKTYCANIRKRYQKLQTNFYTEIGIGTILAGLVSKGT